MSLTRRQLVGLGAVGAGATVAGGAGLWWSGALGGPRGGRSGSDLVEPATLRSSSGVLDLELDAAPTQLRLGDRTATVWTYNGSLPGPTLRLRPGDTLRVRLRNELPEPTNLHVHGLHVSPRDNGDNPFVSVGPGETFDYVITLPADHPPGTYWYHPHHHGHVADQLAAGLYGAIVVEEPDPLPVTRERVLVVSDLTLDDTGHVAQVSPAEQMMGREGEWVLVNGQRRPRLAVRPGERERWRIVNACPSRFLRLRLAGQDTRVLGHDVGRLVEPEQVDVVDLLPGSRVDLLVESNEGSTTLVAEPVDRGGMGMMGQRSGREEVVDLLDLTTTGRPAPTLPPIPAGPARRDLRQEPVVARRTLDFAMVMGGMGAGGMGSGMGSGAMMDVTINGAVFDPDRLDTQVAHGTVEEWTLTNPGPMDHPVHLHVWPMQVVDDAEHPTWRDVVNVPAGGRTTVRVAFDDFDGRTVYHCHILDHEDLGMMGTIEAV